jgi:hypothetical protein
MLRLSLALALSLALVPPARADEPAPPAAASAEAQPTPAPAADGAPLTRPTTARRRVVQALALVSLGLVVAGGVSFGVAVARFDEYRSRCNGECQPSEVADGKLAQTLGWAFAGAGIAFGLTTLILAYVDGRPEPKKIALIPGPGTLSLAGRF